MAIHVTCKCGKKFLIREEMRGRVGVCQECGRKVVATRHQGPIAQAPREPRKGQGREAGRAGLASTNGDE